MDWGAVLNNVIPFPHRVWRAPEGVSEEVIAYYFDKVSQGIPKEEAAELATLFGRVMGFGRGG